MYTSLSSTDEDLRQISREDLIREFFYAAYTYKEIQALLLKRGHPLSVRQIRRVSKSLGLRRHEQNHQSIRQAIHNELQSSGNSLGYRSMKKRLLSKYGINTPRSNVAALLREMDLEGVLLRSRHKLTRRMYRNNGPNFLLHVDGYDKLKRFGFAIHGAICGFSRRVLWLKVNRSNNNPKVVAGYFHEYIDEIRGVPRCIRSDCGTENSLIKNIQIAFRWDHLDNMSGEKSFLRGKSTSNQRIERWWLSSKQGGGQFWIDYFKNLESDGLISTADTERIEVLRFCFTRLIQSDLDQCRQDWNQHLIRKSKNAESPSGKPDLLFFAPEMFGTVDYKNPIPREDIDSLAEFCEYPLPSGCDSYYNNLLKQLCEERGRVTPSSLAEAMELYNWLVTFL